MRSRQQQQTQSGRSGTADNAVFTDAPAALCDPIVTETLPVAACVVRLEPGLFAVEIVDEVAAAGSGEPRVWLGPFGAESGSVDVLSAGGGGAQWLPVNTTGLAVRASKAGQLLMAAAFDATAAPAVTIRPYGAAVAVVNLKPELAKIPPVVEPLPPEREIRIEMTAHIERVGDRVFPGAAWAGTPGGQRRVEGFSIRPLQEIQPSEIEYKALHPGGVETAWIRGPQYCGTRGRALPLTGFAVRVAPHVQDQFSVIYQAAFFHGGISVPRSNGAPCLSKTPGDTIEGINIRISQRRSG